jgi:hypothetical protein
MIFLIVMLEEKMSSCNSSMQFLQNYGPILVVRVDETCCLVQIYIVLLLKAQMV